MKQRHRAAYQTNALYTLHALNISPKQDFFTLNRSQVEGLLVEADRRRYQKPARANGSRARYFYAKLQREARG
jgi:hypothetical protein